MTTVGVVLSCLWLARGAGVSRRARLAANCMAAMAFTQVSVHEGRVRGRSLRTQGPCGQIY